MIGFLRGKLIDKEAPLVVLEISGVGYEIQVPLNCFEQLPELGKEVALYIHLVRREEGDFLYGFLKKSERLLFRSLIKVNGVGPKIALAILSVMELKFFVSHIVNNDLASLSRIPGVGKKTAQRLVVEMKDKIDQWQVELLGVSGTVEFNDAARDAVGALVALGYRPTEASQAIARFKDEQLTSAELIKKALQLL